MKTAGLLLFQVWAYAWVVVSATLPSIAFILGVPFERNGRWLDVCFRSLSHALLFGIGVRVRVEGREHLVREGPTILMANHRSYLDVPALVVACRGTSVRFVAKKSLTQIPFLGWAIARSANVKIDREDARGALREIADGASKLPPRAALVVFPEGTRSMTDHMLPFKKGGFILATSTGLAIQPATVCGSARLFGKKQVLIRPGVIRVRIHPPLRLSGRERAEMLKLMEDVRARIASALPEESAAPGASEVSA